MRMKISDLRGKTTEEIRKMIISKIIFSRFSEVVEDVANVIIETDGQRHVETARKDYFFTVDRFIISNRYKKIILKFWFNNANPEIEAEHVFLDFVVHRSMIQQKKFFKMLLEEQVIQNK